jgi:SAM-dependent methyltransferase
MASETAACLLCGAPGGQRTYPYGTVWNGRRFDYVRCTGCGASFLDPLPGEQDFARMYRKSEYHDEYYEEVAEVTPTRLPQVVRYLKPGGALLDFGCGNGAFMIEAAKAGFACEGVELDPATRARAAANSGRPVRALEEVQAAAARYDVIRLGDVLEHLPDPAGILATLRPLLAQRGLFLIEGPLEDNASLVYYASRAFGGLKKALGRDVSGDYPPYHLFRVSARAQRRFFERRLGWAVRHFAVYETGWPYILPDDSLLRTRSPGRLARMAIGGAGLLAAKGAGLFGAPVGNRFTAVIAPGS